MGSVIGIDFGTTNSLCAWLDGDRPRIILNGRGARMTPSVVAVSSKGEILVGESAKNQALVNPENTIASVKRLLGGGALLTMGGRTWRPEELCALILGALKRDAERQIGAKVLEAVITAPANFSDKERRSLVEAGSLAGLEVLRVVNEPTAAAVARAWAEGQGRGKGMHGRSSSTAGLPEAALTLIYDFGGGTFDVTVLAQNGSDCVVLASRGDGRLGGADIDRELRRLAAAAFLNDFALDVERDRLLSQQLAEQSERAKIELSERLEVTIGLPFALSGGKVIHPSFTLCRGDFEALIRPFVERSIRLTARALSDAGAKAADVDGLVLSGGSSRIPLVRTMLFESFGLKPEGGINPEEIVALGAAVWGGLCKGSERLNVRDVVSRTYGLEIDGGRYLPLIKKNSPVPATKSRIFTTVSEGQDSVEIHVLQGEGELVAENLSLGRFLLAGIRPAGKGEPRIRVDFGIDESDMLHVEAVDLDTGAAQAISIADLDRGASAESKESLARKTGILVDRIEELREGLSLERGLDAELDELGERARRSMKATAAGQGPSEGELRMLKAELESLVGELLARRSEGIAGDVSFEGAVRR